MTMLARWTTRSVLAEPGSLVGSVGGVAMALLLVLLVDGMFAGEAQRIVEYIERTSADVWVMQEGVSNVHMASSLVPRAIAGDVRAVPGVAAGRAQPGPGEAVVPDVMAAKARLALGDRVELLGRRLRVSGISSGTYSMANSVTFVSYDDLAALLSAPEAASYVLVDAAGSLSPDAVADRIRERIDGVNVLTQDALADRDRRLAMQMGVDVIRILTWIGSLAAALIVAFAGYTAVARREREFAVVKALGASNGAVKRSALGHAAMVAAGGWVVAVALAYATEPLIEALLPEISLLHRAALVGRLGVATALIAAAAAWLPARRVGRLDPAIAFRE